MDISLPILLVICGVLAVLGAGIIIIIAKRMNKKKETDMFLGGNNKQGWDDFPKVM